MLGSILTITRDTLQNLLTSRPGALLYITENADWIIKRIGRDIITHLDRNLSIKARISTTVACARNQILHFGSLNTFFRGPRCITVHPSNKTILTIFHLPPLDPRIKNIVSKLATLDRIHTASSLAKKDLIKHGIPPHKITLIPLGVDLDLFQPTTNRKNIREILGLPNDKIIIGSFQKDGEGWKEGETPKLIKGPDIFCQVVKEIARVRPIHVLLTGPARGYVKNKLRQSHIPFTHRYVRNCRDLVKHYQSLDIYLVTSRVEGGPMAILESMACGIPIISTPVGMAPDIIKDGSNGFIRTHENIREYANTALRIISDPNIQSSLSNNALQTVLAFDWSKIILRYNDLLYQNI